MFCEFTKRRLCATLYFLSLSQNICSGREEQILKIPTLLIHATISDMLPWLELRCSFMFCMWFSILISIFISIKSCMRISGDISTFFLLAEVYKMQEDWTSIHLNLQFFHNYYPHTLIHLFIHKVYPIFIPHSCCVDASSILALLNFFNHSEIISVEKFPLSFHSAAVNMRNDVMMHE